MFLFSFFRKSVAIPAISFGVTVCNEQEELEKLLTQLLSVKKEKDQVIVLQDITNPHPGVTDVIARYAGEIIHLEAKLEGDFSNFKNKLIAQATGDYLFQIDADELLTDTLVEKLHRYLQKNSYYDCFCIPRLNSVKGITPAHFEQWNWTQNKDGYINFPDYQMRLFKLKGSKIHWMNKVHEVLIGFKRLKKLPIKGYSFCLIHDKKIKKQEQQNEFYEANF